MEYYPPLCQRPKFLPKVAITYIGDLSKRRMQAALGLSEAADYGDPRVQMVAKRWETFFQQQESNRDTANKSPTLDYAKKSAAVSANNVYLQQLRELISRRTNNSSRASSFSSSTSSSLAAATRTKSSGCFGINPLLMKLKQELSMATSNFRTDFIHQNGITMLCEALKKLQDEIAVWENSDCNDDLEMLKNKMVDEFHCIMCIKFAAKDLDGCDEILNQDAENLEIVCQSLLSPCMQSRIAVMDFLSNLLRAYPSGSLQPILQQFTTLRVRYAQSDRFRFLACMTRSKGKLNLLFKAALLGMTNEMLMACPSGNYQVFLQTELEEAGLNVDDIEKAATLLAGKTDDDEDAIHVIRQVKIWRENYIVVHKPGRNHTQKMKSTESGRSTSSSLPTYEYGSEYTSSPSPCHIALPPNPPVLPPRTSSSSGEIRVVIKSVSPTSENGDFANFSHNRNGCTLQPPPMPTTCPPKFELLEANHIRPLSPPQQQLFHSDLRALSSTLLPSASPALSTRSSVKSGSQLPFGREAKQIQNSGLNQRIADKFSDEFHSWQKKRSGDSQESGESSDGDSQSLKAAVYLVDGISPAQRTMIDDVLLQFDRAYDVLTDGCGSLADKEVITPNGKRFSRDFR